MKGFNETLNKHRGFELFEEEAKFAPTFCLKNSGKEEAKEREREYDSKRCPGWPDRVLLTPRLKNSVLSLCYDSWNMGVDHDTVYLLWKMERKEEEDEEEEEEEEEEREREEEKQEQEEKEEVGRSVPERKEKGLSRILPLLVCVSVFVSYYYFTKYN